MSIQPLCLLNLEDEGLNSRGEHLAQLAHLGIVATALLFKCELVLRSFLLSPTLELEPLDNKRLLS